MTNQQQCKHWRYVDGGGRILKAEYANPTCAYCEIEKANADFRELLMTNGRIAERNLSLSAEIERLASERDEARSMADQANSLVDSLREERAADLARAFDTGHHHGALGIMEIPEEYRQPVSEEASR